MAMNHVYELIIIISMAKCKALTGSAVKGLRGEIMVSECVWEVESTFWRAALYSQFPTLGLERCAQNFKNYKLTLKCANFSAF